MSSKYGLQWALALGLGLIMPTGVSAQEACTTYTVRDGDTLGSIAEAEIRWRDAARHYATEAQSDEASGNP